MKLPNFFVVGAPKAATTFLYACLDQHPQIYMSPLKEPHYFASELRPENFNEEDRPRIVRQTRELQAYLRGDMREKHTRGLITTWEDYGKLFANASTQLAVGEASPCYLWSETAARNIASRLPNARIIINLRNPVDRAFSHYLHELTAGVTNRTFRQEIEATLRTRPRKFGLDRSLLEFGHYCEQIKRYQREFPRSQIYICLYEDLERSPEAMMKSLFAFLGVDPDIPVDVSIRPHEARIPRLNSVAYVLKKWRLWPHLRNLLPQPLGPRLRSLLIRSRASLVMSPADRAFLIEYYRDEINNLAALLGHDLTAWLDPLMPHRNLTPDSVRGIPDAG